MEDAVSKALFVYNGVPSSLYQIAGKVALQEKSVLETVLVFVLGLTPPVLSIWIMHRVKERAQARLREAAHVSVERVLQRNQTPPDRYYLEGVGYLIGDITCRFNARSPYIRCAVNPSGPCQGCYHYETRE